MPNNDNNPFEEIANVPANIQNLWITAYNQAMMEGNSPITCRYIAWAVVRQKFQQNDKNQWIERKVERRSDEGIPIRWLEDNIPIDSDRLVFNDDGSISIHIATIGDVVSQGEADDWLKNYESKAYVQELPLAAEHPFHNPKNNNPDGRARGWMKNLYIKGKEVWGDFFPTPLGVKEILGKEYLYVSPGWFPEYIHKITGEKVTNVLFEVSLTNIPAQKWLNKIIQLAETPGYKPVIIKRINENKALETQGPCLVEKKNNEIPIKEETKLSNETKKLEEFEGQVKALQDQLNSILPQLKQEQDARKAAEAENVKKAEELQAVRKEQRKSSITRLLEEKFLPREGVQEYRVKASQKDEIVGFAMTLSDEQEKTFLKILSETPAKIIPLGEKGVSGTTPEDVQRAEERLVEQDKKMLSEAEIVFKASEVAEKEDNPKKRWEVYQREVKRLHDEQEKMKGGQA